MVMSMLGIIKSLRCAMSDTDLHTLSHVTASAGKVVILIRMQFWQASHQTTIWLQNRPTLCCYVTGSHTYVITSLTELRFSAYDVV